MSKRLKKFAPTLQYLAKCDHKTAKALINKQQPQFIDCVSDICHNILRGKVQLSTKEKNRLRKYKNKIRKVASNTSSRKAKKNIIQSGGFLASILLPLLGTLIGPLVRGIFKRKK